MALYPQSFIDDLKHHADIVVVIQDYVSLKKTGANYKGLCPFHGEKTPSFQRQPGQGVLPLLRVRRGRRRHQVPRAPRKGRVPGRREAARSTLRHDDSGAEQSDEQRASAAEREALLKIHEWPRPGFVKQLLSPAGMRIRRQIADRGISDATAEAMGLGFAPPSRTAMKDALLEQGFSEGLLLRAGLLVQRDEGPSVDRFRNRLMIPIRRDTGSVIAFGGRAVDADQQPKYLNSPETPIYSKGRTLYGLDLSKAAIRQKGFGVLVEGYFDFGQVYQAGFPVVASCGTALTPQQVQQLHRFASKVVLSFDPDAAGQGAAAKSCELFVADGFDVNVAELPAGQDPDAFIRAQGGAGYGERLKQSKPYLEYLLDRTAAGYNLNSDEGRVKFLAAMLPTAARIPDAAMRDRFADRLAFKANVTDEVVRAKIREAAVQKQTTFAPSTIPSFGHVTKAEKALIWCLVHEPDTALAALADFEPSDFEGLASRSVLDLARRLNDNRGFSPSVLLERLNMVEAQLVTAIASEPEPPALSLGSCVRELRRARYERERAAVQRAIAQLQTRGAATGGELDALLARKGELGRLIQALVISED